MDKNCNIAEIERIIDRAPPDIVDVYINYVSDIVINNINNIRAEKKLPPLSLRIKESKNIHEGATPFFSANAVYILYAKNIDKQEKLRLIVNELGYIYFYMYVCAYNGGVFETSKEEDEEIEKSAKLFVKTIMKHFTEWRSKLAASDWF